MKNNGVKLNDITLMMKKIVNIGTFKKITLLNYLLERKTTLRLKLFSSFLFEFSIALVINRGVSVFIGFTVVLRLFGNPLI